MKAYNEIISNIINSEEGKNILSEMNNKENKMLARLKAEDQLKNLVGSELEKNWDEELQVPNINDGGKTFVDATFFNPYSVAKFEMKNHKVRA